jgi:hypothetical protein
MPWLPTTYLTLRFKFSHCLIAVLLSQYDAMDVWLINVIQMWNIWSETQYKTVMLFVQKNWALGVRYLHLNKCILCHYYKHSESLKISLGILNHFPCYFVLCQGQEKGRGSRRTAVFLYCWPTFIMCSPDIPHSRILNSGTLFKLCLIVHIAYIGQF